MHRYQMPGGRQETPETAGGRGSAAEEQRRPRSRAAFTLQAVCTTRIASPRFRAAWGNPPRGRCHRAVSASAKGRGAVWSLTHAGRPRASIGTSARLHGKPQSALELARRGAPSHRPPLPPTGQRAPGLAEARRADRVGHSMPTPGPGTPQRPAPLVNGELSGWTIQANCIVVAGRFGPDRNPTGHALDLSGWSDARVRLHPPGHRHPNRLRIHPELQCVGGQPEQTLPRLSECRGPGDRRALRELPRRSGRHSGNTGPDALHLGLQRKRHFDQAHVLLGRRPGQKRRRRTVFSPCGAFDRGVALGSRSPCSLTRVLCGWADPESCASTANILRSVGRGLSGWCWTVTDQSRPLRPLPELV